MAGSKAAQWSQLFHGRPDFTVRLGGKTYVVIGYLESAEYTVPAGSARSGRLWRHEMGDYGNGRRTSARPLLVADPATGEVRLVKGRSGLKFDPRRGLVG